ncbi:MAG TPA: glycoside hydrolase family 19 protein [Geobacteraceae bacterium]
MCISKSVGRKGVNNRDDVKTVQILINMNIDKLTPLNFLAEDGRIGNITINAIEEFQRRVMSVVNPDGRVDPDGATLKRLREGIPDTFTEKKLKGIMIHATESNVKKYYNALNTKMKENGIDNTLRMAHFLAQLAHESAELRYSEEIASGEAYEGRADLGNTEPGDGKRFKGRGLIQLTGRSNYNAFGDARGKDYTTDTTNVLLATDPFTAVDVSGWFWTEHDLNSLADVDDVAGITLRINGGYNGLADRKAKLARAKFFLMR